MLRSTCAGGLRALGLSAAALAACAHGPSTSGTQARAPGTAVASAGDVWTGDCATMVPGTAVVVTDLPEGASLTLTLPGGDVKELRRRAAILATVYNDRYDHPDPPREVRQVQAPRITAGGGYGAGGDEGIKEVQVPGRPPSWAGVEAIPRGARIELRTNGKAEVDRVRSRAARLAVEMWAGNCPGVG